MSTIEIPETGFFREYVEVYGPLTEVPTESHLACAIALLSAAVGWRGWLSFGEAREPLTVWTLVTGPSGSGRKSAATGQALALLRRAVKEIDPDARPLKAIKGGHVSRAGLFEALGAINEEIAERYEQEPPPGALMEWDEFGTVLAGQQDSADYRADLRRALMEVYGGRQSGIRTRQKFIPDSRVALGLVASMTIEELRDRADEGLFRSGLVSRFLIIESSGRARLMPVPANLDQAGVHRRTRLAAWLKAIATSPAMGDVWARFTPEARDERSLWYHAGVSSIDADGMDADARESLSRVWDRTQTVAAKIAALSAIAAVEPDSKGNFTNDLPWQVEITVEHVRWGQAVADASLNVVKSLLQDASPSSAESKFEDKALRYIAGRIRDGDEHVPVRDVLMNTRTRAMRSYRQRKQLLLALVPEVIDLAPIPGEGGRTIEAVVLSDASRASIDDLLAGG